MITLEIPASEFIKRFQAGEIPTSARVTVTYEGDENQDPALTLIEQWISQAPTESTSIQEAEEDLREVQQALNSTRQKAGSRILYPSSENS